MKKPMNKKELISFITTSLDKVNFSMQGKRIAGVGNIGGSKRMPPNTDIESLIVSDMGDVEFRSTLTPYPVCVSMGGGLTHSCDRSELKNIIARIEKYLKLHGGESATLNALLSFGDMIENMLENIAAIAGLDKVRIISDKFFTCGDSEYSLTYTGNSPFPNTITKSKIDGSGVTSKDLSHAPHLLTYNQDTLKVSLFELSSLNGGWIEVLPGKLLVGKGATTKKSNVNTNSDERPAEAAVDPLKVISDSNGKTYDLAKHKLLPDPLGPRFKKCTYGIVVRDEIVVGIANLKRDGGHHGFTPLVDLPDNLAIVMEANGDVEPGYLKLETKDRTPTVIGRVQLSTANAVSPVRLKALMPANSKVREYVLEQLESITK